MFPEYVHKVVQELDDGTPMTFRWHFPRGTFDPRMSVKELIPFLMPHMPAILPLLTGRARFEWAMLLVLCEPDSPPDEVVDWIKVVPNCEEDQILELDLRPKTRATPGGAWFVLGDKRSQ